MGDGYSGDEKSIPRLWRVDRLEADRPNASGHTARSRAHVLPSRAAAVLGAVVGCRRVLDIRQAVGGMSHRRNTGMTQDNLSDLIERLEVRIVPRADNRASPRVALERANNERAKAARELRRLQGEVEELKESVQRQNAKWGACTGRADTAIALLRRLVEADISPDLVNAVSDANAFLSRTKEQPQPSQEKV